MKYFLLIVVSFMFTGCYYGFDDNKKNQIDKVFQRVLSVAENTSCIVEKDWFFDTITLSFTTDDFHHGGVTEHSSGYIGPYVAITELNIDYLDSVYIEYGHISRDAEIGNFSVKSENEYWAALLAHEVSHAIIEWNKYQILDKGHLSNYIMLSARKQMREFEDMFPSAFGVETWDIDCLPRYDDVGHDKEWQHVYRKLRRRMNLVR